jgi:hypothetical protein
MNKLKPLRFVMLALLTLLGCSGANAQSPSFGLKFSDQLNTGGNPGPYDTTVQFTVLHDGGGYHLRLDVNNTSGTWIDTLGFNLSPALTLSNYVLSGAGTSGYSASSVAGKNLSAFGRFNAGFTLSGPNGGHLSATNWSVTADISGYNGNSTISSSINHSGWLGAIHFGPINGQPTLWAGSKTLLKNNPPPPSYNVSVTKTASVNTICAGVSTDVIYTYTVKNTGDDKIQVKLVDDKLGTIATGVNLYAGQTKTFTKKTQISSTVTNTVTVTGTCNNKPVATATATATVTATTCSEPEHGITVSKTASVTSICSGVKTKVTYTYTVKNTGEKTVQVKLVDDKLGTITDDLDVRPGQTKTVTACAYLSSTVTNTVTATAYYHGKSVATATDQAKVTASTCSDSHEYIKVTKEADTDTICAGSDSEVTYTYTVKNVGDKKVQVKLVDDKLGTIAYGVDLYAGQTKTFTKTTHLSNTVTNTVYATATYYRQRDRDRHQLRHQPRKDGGSDHDLRRPRHPGHLHLHRQERHVGEDDQRGSVRRQIGIHLQGLHALSGRDEGRHEDRDPEPDDDQHRESHGPGALPEVVQRHRLGDRHRAELFRRHHARHHAHDDLQGRRLGH